MKRRNAYIEFAEPFVKPKPRTVHESELAEMRLQFDVTQHAAAEALGISRSLVALVEAGERSLPFTLAEARARLDRYTLNREKDKALMRSLFMAGEGSAYEDRGRGGP
jgi:DNA-binding XRE family transcriptional regulator